MIRQFIETTIFNKRWSEMGLTDSDLLELQNQIMKNTQVGDVIAGTRGARKIRYALPHKVKSGGARVIYVDIIQRMHIHLLLCYPKSKQAPRGEQHPAMVNESRSFRPLAVDLITSMVEDLTPEQKKIVAQLTKTLKG